MKELRDRQYYQNLLGKKERRKKKVLEDTKRSKD